MRKACPPIRATLPLLLVFASNPASASAQQRTLEFSVDPRIELLAAVQLLSSYEERYNLITDVDTPYKRAMAEYFGPYAKHAAVQLFDELSADGFAFDAPPSIMLHLSEPPSLRPIIEIPEVLVGRAGGSEKLDRFLQSLRDFAVASDFAGFFGEQRPTIDAMVEVAESTAEASEWIATLEAYYGMRQHGYHIVLAPIFQGNYGPRIQRADGSYDLYSVVGTRGVVDGVPVFGNTASFRHLALHEFGHSFVNPTTSRFEEEVYRYEGLLGPIQERMRSMAYGSWEPALNEHILRAVTTRMIHNREGPAAGERALNYERNRGFIYVPALVEKLAEYEANRDRFPTFVDFYPELLGVLAELSTKDIVKEFRLDEFGGPIAAATSDEGSVVLIMPTAESDPKAQEQIEEYVRMVHERFFSDAPLLTDREALERDLARHDIVAYGTLSGNLWLAAHADALPIRVLPDRVVADSTYAGEHLRVITAVPSPYDRAHAVLVYTAQAAADVPGINGVIHGQTDYVIASGTERLAEGFYRKEAEHWSF